MSQIQSDIANKSLMQSAPTVSASGYRVKPSPLSRLQRWRQYQPSQRLVKVLLAWWLMTVLLTALQMTQGFGNAALANFFAQGNPHHGIDGLLMISLAALLMLFLVTLADVIALIGISQPAQYTLHRQHPSNVSVLHQFEVSASLSFTTATSDSVSNTFAHNIAKQLVKFGVLTSISVDFYEDYPDHIMPVDAPAASDAIFKPAMPIRVIMDIAPTLSTTSIISTISTSTSSVSIVNIDYPVIAIQRGTGYFGAAAIRVWSPLQLFKRQFKLPTPQDSQAYLRVLADFSGLLNNQLAAVFEHSINMGVQSLLQQGHGSDFLKLREYTPGDAIRQIDWKASSRQRRLMSKSYEDDNDQDVMFLLDCGEQMRHYDGYNSDDGNEQHKDINQVLAAELSQPLPQASYFDNVLNAVLLLAYVANKQSDRVGLMSFAGEPLYLPPKKGTALIRNLLNATADLQPSMLTSDYLSAAQDLLKRLHKRSLVVVITNTRAEATTELTQALQLLSKRHQVVFANLTEQVVQDRLYGEVPPENFDDVLLYHALNQYQQERSRLHQNLSQQTGALCLQTTASQLPMRLTQAYLSLKGR